MKNLKVLGMTVALSPLSALAALPASVGTAITDATTDGTDLGWKMVVFAVTVGVVFYLKRRAG